jgi:peptide/nickel transport system ATP-binding protein
MSPGNLVEINNLSIAFGKAPPVVNNISFAIEHGKSIAIVGESGSGKTLSSLAIMKLLPKEASIIHGEITFSPSSEKATNLLALEEAQLMEIRGNQISMIFQEPMSSLNPSMTCGNQVMEALLHHRIMSPKDAYLKVLDLFNEVQLPRIKEIFNSYPHQLSGGQRQRVMIAMAISCKPKLLIADEPTTALDVTVQKTILALLNQLREKYEMSLLFVTHDLGIVSEIAENIVVMHQGKIVEQGTTLKILHSPENDYTKGLVACRPPLSEKPYRLKTIDQFISKERIEEQILKPEKNREITREPLLEIKNLTTEFVGRRNLWGTPMNKLTAVNNVSFNVYPEETIGVVGESGCGKTTLGRTILRLIDQASGQVYYRGVEISKLDQKQFRNFRKHLQIVFQNPFSSLNPKLTVGEALMEPMIFHGILKNNKERKHRVLELLKKVKLQEEHFDRFPHEFSGGQRQRIGIARALCVEPEIIICDESVSSLDVSVQAQVLNLLNDLKEEFGLTYIFISHDLSVIKYMCDRVLVMGNGQIEEIGEPDKIFMEPVSEVTKKLVRSIPGIESNWI